MYGSGRVSINDFCRLVVIGPIPTKTVKLKKFLNFDGQVRSGHARFISCQVMSDQTRSDNLRSCQVRLSYQMGSWS